MAMFRVSEKTGRNLKDIKLSNRAIIFRAIREAQTISRADLAKLTGLNPATITNIARELLEQGLIEEAGFSGSKGGRPSALLKICSKHSYIIAVRVSRHNIHALLTDLDLQYVVRRSVNSSSLSHPVDISRPTLLNLIQTLITQSGVDPTRISGIGICAPGPLDAQRGMLIAPPNFPSWPSTPIASIVESEIGFPTFLDNDANAAALAEKWFGGAKELNNFIYILIEDGVGGGLVFNGDIYRGEHDVAGEIGHMTIDFNGPRCDCGNLGCLELYTSPRTVEEYLLKAIASGQTTLVKKMTDSSPQQVTFESVVKAAMQGDAIAREAMFRFTDALVVGVVNVINMFDPGAVVLGGKIGLAGDLILPRLKQEVARRLLPRGNKEIPILISELSEDAPIIGAFCLVLRELFHNPDFQRDTALSVQ